MPVPPSHAQLWTGKVSMSKAEMRALLRWIHEESRKALFEKTSRAACQKALPILSEINKRTADV